MKAYKQFVNEATRKVDIVEFDIDYEADFSHDPVTNLYDSDSSHNTHEDIVIEGTKRLNTMIARGDYNLVKCRDCNRYFLLPKSEKKWFEERNLVAPKRCPRCRKRK